jgi:Putative DNA-binding domain
MGKSKLDGFDISQIPQNEDDEFEFKSSQTPPNKLNEKLGKAASGFSNSGGGFFIVGINNDTGDVDGGISSKVGNQDLRDWVDNVVHKVEPAPTYEVMLLNDIQGRGRLNQDCVVLVVYFHESYVGPHMASDRIYYIRAGAHTLPAKHFIIEAIWAKRHFLKPRLTHLFRLKPGKEQTIQLGILSVTNSAAIDVTVNLSPIPQLMSDCTHLFPLRVPVIDQNNPFFFDVTTYAYSEERFGKNVQLILIYSDLSGNSYTYETQLDIMGSVPPINIGNDYLEKIADSLVAIQKEIPKLQVSKEIKPTPVYLLKTPSTDSIKDIECLIPELFNQFRLDLMDDPLVREFILMNERAMYDGVPEKQIFVYYYEVHTHLRSKLQILENHALIREVTFNNVDRFIMSEELVSYLQATSERNNDVDTDGDAS